jgi:endoglycosylceramidase
MGLAAALVAIAIVAEPEAGAATQPASAKASASMSATATASITKSATASSAVLPAAPIGHAGQWITDATGKVVLVSGVNMVNKLTPYTPAADGFDSANAAFLADNAPRRGPRRSAVGGA